MALMPLIPNLIADAESIFGKGNGAAKKEAVTDVLNQGVQVLAGVSTGGQKNTVEKLQPYISTMIDSAVSIANEAGAFGKTAADASGTGTQSNG